VSISVESRKRLWGRSGGKCAICREALFVVAAGYDTIVGQEAHIIARSPGGPRRDFMTALTKIDDYSNLVLLCPTDHAIVDAQPAQWTVERLLEVKTAHEQWVKALPPEERVPVKVVPGPDYWTKGLYPVYDGPALWRIVAAAHSFRFDHPADATPDDLDYLAGLFDGIKDWGELASFLDSKSEERNAERALDELIKEAVGKAFLLIGRRVDLVLTGGVGADSTWPQAEVQAWRPDQFLAAVVEERESRSGDADASSG
jgi:hypothetical protein